MNRNLVRLLSVVLVAGSAGCLASSAIADDKPEPTLTSLHLDCSDFVHNNDGTWSPVQAISFNGIIMSPDISYRVGDVIDGVKIVELLEHECVSR
jgi:hypothetical protein